MLAAAARVHLLEIQAAAQVRAFVGEPVTLKCWFKSSAPVTEKLTVDWTYRPLAGGNLEPVSCGGPRFRCSDGPEVVPCREGR